MMKVEKETNIYYEIHGNIESKYSLLFVHGSGGNANALKDLADCLTSYKCVLLDLPGHHRSKCEIPAKIEDYSAILKKFIDNIQNEIGDNIIYVGHSMGGFIGLQCAIDKVPQIKAIVILNSGAKVDLLPSFINKARKGRVDKLFLFKAGGSYFSLRTYKFFLKSFKEMIASEKVMCKDLMMCDVFDVRDKVKNISIPTLIATGEKEILTKVEYSEFLKKEIANSELIIFPKVAHLMPIVIPEKVAEAIEAFIGRL